MRNANKTPRQTMREVRVEEEIRDIPLKQAQYIKRRVMAEKFRTARLGDLVSIVNRDTEMPRDTYKGWWCHADIVSESAGAGRITLVATSRKMIDRCASAAFNGCVISADGGHKFCLMGWPLTIIGVNNRAGSFGVVAFCLSNSSSTEHVTSMMQAFKAAVVREHPSFAGFEFSMSDSEDCYRTGLKETFTAQPLQCWFHTKQDFMEFHRRLPQTQQFIL